MSELDPAQNTPAEPVEAPDQAPADDTSEDGLDPAVRAKIKRVNSEARNLRERVKQLEPEAERAAELQTTVQTLTDEVTSLQTQLATEQTSLRKLRVALGAGVPAQEAEEFADRLRGETDEELAEDAERLKALFKVATNEGSKAPQRDHSQGLSREANMSPEVAFTGFLESKLRR